jgi:hypothetical protein
MGIHQGRSRPERSDKKNTEERKKMKMVIEYEIDSKKALLAGSNHWGWQRVEVDPASLSAECRTILADQKHTIAPDGTLTIRLFPPYPMDPGEPSVPAVVEILISLAEKKRQEEEEKKRCQIEADIELSQELTRCLERPDRVIEANGGFSPYRIPGWNAASKEAHEQADTIRIIQALHAVAELVREANGLHWMKLNQEISERFTPGDFLARDEEEDGDWIVRTPKNLPEEPHVSADMPWGRVSYISDLPAYIALRKEAHREAEARNQRRETNRLKDLDGFIRENGTKNQVERWEAGVLPEKEVLALIEAFSFGDTLDDLPRYQRITRAEVADRAPWCDPERIQFSVTEAETVSAAEWNEMREILEAMDAAPTGTRVNVYVHSGYIDDINKPLVTRRAYHVTVPWGADDYGEPHYEMTRMYADEDGN